MRIVASLVAILFALSVTGSALAADATVTSTDGAATSQSQQEKGDVKKVSKKTKKTKKAKKKAKSKKNAAEMAEPIAQ